MRATGLLNYIGRIVSCVKHKINRVELAELMRRGLKIGKNVYIMEDVYIDNAYPFLVEIGDNCRISKGVRIVAHDPAMIRELGAVPMACVRILEGTFIGERAILLPGVTVGPRALIAAGSVVSRDVKEGATAAGNPARPYGTYSGLLQRNIDIIKSSTVFQEEEIEKGRVTSEDIINALKKNPLAFVRGVPGKDPYYIHTDYVEIRKDAVLAYERLSPSAPPSDSVTPEAGKEDQ